MRHICEYCQSDFESNLPAAKYCSPAHKQAAYRQRIKIEKSTPDTFGNLTVDNRAPQEKTHQTKIETIKPKRCLWCNEWFQPNGYQQKAKFCSNAHKQAWYRAGHPKQVVNKSHTSDIKHHLSDEQAIASAWSDALEDE